MKTSEKWILWTSLGLVSVLLLAALVYAAVQNIKADNARIEQVERERVAAEAAFLKTPEGKVELARRQEEQRMKLAEEMTRIDRVEVSSWDGSVDEVKKFIARSVRDPSAVKYNQWKNFTNDTNHITTVDFTATNGFGGPSRETWVFSFEKLTGKLQTVFDGNKFLYDAVGAEVK